ncbi:MAG: glycosyl hydrolase 53 family protein [Clostridiales bacterium]|nr:glycosyl hydrolase 53 family protein [Clostridiales bacterium]
MIELNEYIKGADVSTLIEEEAHGARYYDNGAQGDLLDILKTYGFNWVRIRLWNDPYAEDGTPYGAGTNDLKTYVKIARRAKSVGLKVLLCIHYSDFWADPGKQTVPKSWRGLTIPELSDAVHSFTLDALNAMKAAGAEPDMVAVGNEVTNGLLWPYGRKPEFDNIALFISSGVRACREFDPSMPVMIHLDNGGNNSMYVEWFDNYFMRGEDIDVIGLSYYPFWHGTMASLEYNIRDMEKRYGKQTIVAEVSTGFTMEDYASYEGLAPEERKGYATSQALVEKVEFPMTPEGQCDFMRRFLKGSSDSALNKGFFYWEPGWIPVPGVGWANEAALKYTGEKGPGGNEWANQALFDYDGNALPSLKVIRDFKPQY